MNGLKVLSMVATVIGLGATLLSNYVSDKKMDATIDEKLNLALAEKNSGKESE